MTAAPAARPAGRPVNPIFKERAMTPLLKNLLGNGSRDHELAEEMRAMLQEVRRERERFEALQQGVEASADRLGQLGEPIARAGSEVDAVASRLEQLEQRFAAMAQLAAQFQAMEQRAQDLARDQAQSGTEIARSIEDAQRARAAFDEIAQKVDAALDLKDRLGAFLEVDRPLQQLKGDADTIRSQVDGTGEHLARLREQHDRLIDAHKLAMSKMEALDRRRDDLSRSMQDKERRVASVEQAVQGMDGVQHTVEGVKREINTLKALGDSVVQKTAALEAQREAIERALAQADQLERAMRQLDGGVRQQQENEQALAALQDQVAALRSLHETVVERSAEISQLQREANEQTQSARRELGAMTDEMRKTVERFDFEGRGLESVSERVADLRGSLTDFEQRYQGLAEARQAVVELKSQTQATAAQLHTLAEEVGHVDREIVQLRGIRRDLDQTGAVARDIATKVTQIEQARPAVEAGLRDLEQLRGAHALVKDTLDQASLAHDEIARMRQAQSETKTWMAGVELGVNELRGQVGELNALAPAIDHALRQAERVTESTQVIEARREFLDEMQRRLAELGALAARLEQRDQQLHGRMEAAEQRFVALGVHADEAERLGQSIAEVTSQVGEAERKTGQLGKAVAAIAARCESVEELAEKTRALKPELDQRHKSLSESAKDLQRAAALRKEAATAAQQLEEVAKHLDGAVKSTAGRANEVDRLAAQLEDRTAELQVVESRFAHFETRIAEWEPLENRITRSLEQIAARQGTLEALQADHDRMLAMAEKTATAVREITSAQQEIEQSRELLESVMGRLGEVRETANTLDERRRQMTKAEERLARADAMLVDVQSSFEALQGQKAIVDQALEKAGSLQFLLKQAEATIESLRAERELSGRVRPAISIVRHDDTDDEDEITRAA
jgi:chromosome segregation ATPase